MRNSIKTASKESRGEPCFGARGSPDGVRSFMRTDLIALTLSATGWELTRKFHARPAVSWSGRNGLIL
jgi:hypothetical protein